MGGKVGLIDYSDNKFVDIAYNTARVVVNKGYFINGLKTGEWKVYIKDRLWRLEKYKYGEKDIFCYSYDDQTKIN
tara:strand:- start:6291 stop:6515 length:225 start_codon:yes stop_codon:yes gene_type:complete